ncbi:hypothetical protein POTOM_018379 [Populus tomentosa]|uniref:Uncharacterized protein n=1 Tax=Populus tomentosa TaxID=118781 RepID=A0A8X7ZSS8_POPTO|nr:hypothetical protein POTOM_018379 [Populus tomentosa]
MLSSCNNLPEIDAQQVARFVRGLRWAIQDRVVMQTIYTLTEAIALAIKAATQLDKSKAAVIARNSFDNNRAIVNKGKAPMTQPYLSSTTRGTSSSGGPTKPVNIVSSKEKMADSKQRRTRMKWPIFMKRKSGSSENIVSKAMVTKLGLQTKKTLHRIRLVGLNRVLNLKVVLGPIKEEFSIVESKSKGKPIFLVDEDKFIEETKEAKEIFAVVVRGEVGKESMEIPPVLIPLLEEF